MFGFLKSKKKNIEPENPLKSSRFNDGILIITQDNIAKSLKIEAANVNALNLLGYAQEDLLDKDLREFLTSSISDEINEYLEFQEVGEEFDKVLRRIRRFKMRNKKNDAVSLSLRVVRSLSTAENPRFQMIINDGSLMQSIEENREEYRANFRGDEIFDFATGLLSKESITKDIELIRFTADKRDLNSTLVKVEIENYSQIKSEHGAELGKRFIKQVAKRINKNKRENDIIGIFGEGRFAMILTETPQDNVKIPITRLNEILNSELYKINTDDGEIPIEPSFDIKSYRIDKESSLEELLS